MKAVAARRCLRADEPFFRISDKADFAVVVAFGDDFHVEGFHYFGSIALLQAFLFCDLFQFAFFAFVILENLDGIRICGKDVLDE